MNVRKNEGITLVALVITIVILLILSGISISRSIKGAKETQDAVSFNELKIVQHAIVEWNTKAQLTEETLPGTTIQKSEVQLIVNEMNTVSGENIELKATSTEYKELDKDDLENLGITGEDDIFIVNYDTGEVINKTLKTTKSKKALYTYLKDEN